MHLKAESAIKFTFKCAVHASYSSKPPISRFMTIPLQLHRKVGCMTFANVDYSLCGFNRKAIVPPLVNAAL